MSRGRRWFAARPCANPSVWLRNGNRHLGICDNERNCSWGGHGGSPNGETGQRWTGRGCASRRSGGRSPVVCCSAESAGLAWEWPLPAPAMRAALVKTVAPVTPPGSQDSSAERRRSPDPMADPRAEVPPDPSPRQARAVSAPRATTGTMGRRDRGAATTSKSGAGSDRRPSQARATDPNLARATDPNLARAIGPSQARALGRSRVTDIGRRVIPMIPEIPKTPVAQGNPANRVSQANQVSRVSRRSRAGSPSRAATAKAPHAGRAVPTVSHPTTRRPNPSFPRA